MYCNNCGMENDDNSKYCTYCGKKLLKEEPVPNVSPIKSSNTNNYSYVDENIIVKPKEKERSVVWLNYLTMNWILLGILLIIYAIIFLFDVDDYLSSALISASAGILSLITGIFMYKKMYYGYHLSLITIVAHVIFLAIYAYLLLSQVDSYAILSSLFMILIAIPIWIIPNFIYIYKRRGMFKKNKEE